VKSALAWPEPEQKPAVHDEAKEGDEVSEDEDISEGGYEDEDQEPEVRSRSQNGRR